MRIDWTQALELGFFVVGWASLLLILIVAPDVYDEALRIPAGSTGAALGFFTGLSVFPASTRNRRGPPMALDILADPGRVYCWLLRVPAGILDLAGFIGHTGPTWYVLFRMALGLVQFAIAFAMLGSYRHGGTHDDWPTYDRVMAEESRAVILIRPERSYGNHRS